jgi:hypothetical protein
MKKTLIVLVTIAALLLVSYSVVSLVAVRAHKQVNESLQRVIAPAAALPDRSVSQNNETAAKLEAMVQPLGIEVRPRGERPESREFATPQLKEAMQTWLRTQEENATDAISPMPDELHLWLKAHRAEVDTIATFLSGAEIPRWRAETRGLRLEQPIPNLLGHMILFRLFSMA